jgi:exosortase C (VPDSG-CTERM-specific)
MLIPPISLYLVWLKRKSLPEHSAPSHSLAFTILGSGCLVMATYHWAVIGIGVKLGLEDSLAITTLSFVLIFLGLCTWFFGRQTLLHLCFPLCFLLLMVPFPTTFVSFVDTFLQYGSVSVALVLFDLFGTPVFHQGLTLQLPTITLEVAPECSGIHSSLALLITSLVAGYLFLNSYWKRALLALVVIPLALLRNGFRVFVIGELCVHIGPEMINSYIHRHGGPIFFAVSLVPFSIILYLLIRSDRLSTNPNFNRHE